MIIGGVIITLVIFAAGVSVGIHKARFSDRFANNYERNFAPPRGPIDFMRGMEGQDFRNAHGIAGTIISITDNNIIVKDRGNKENTIAVSDKTVINRGRDNIKISDLKTDDEIVVMGKPADNGVINADLIRVFDNNGPQNQ